VRTSPALNANRANVARTERQARRHFGRQRNPACLSASEHGLAHVHAVYGIAHARQMFGMRACAATQLKNVVCLRCQFANLCSDILCFARVILVPVQQIVITGVGIEHTAHRKISFTAAADRSI